MITPKLLKTWNPCADGYKRFLQLFPEGAELGIAIDTLVQDNHDDWGYWLFCECRKRGLYKDFVSTGYRNSGNWNSGDWNSGFFNVDMPRTVRVFGVQIEKVEWDMCYKPAFLQFSISEWITIGAMTDADKINHPDYDIVGGYLKVRPYKDAFRRSWEQADPADRIRIKDVPGFNADMFFEISGIDLREEKP